MYIIFDQYSRNCDVNKMNANVGVSSIIDFNCNCSNE